MISSIINSTRAIILIATLLSSALYAQDSSVSPYSGFGLGDISAGGFIAQQGMGATGVGLVERLQVNPLNPATGAFLKGPVFQLGVLTQLGTFSSQEQSVKNNLTRFDHFALGFPLAKGNWGLTFGLDPLTSVGYRSLSSSTVQDSILQMTEYNGEGGIYRMFFDLSKRITLSKDTTGLGQHTELALGAELDFYFGTIRDTRNSTFPNEPGFFNARLQRSTTVNDISGAGGLLLRNYLKAKKDEDDDQWILDLGLRYEADARLAAERNQDFYTYVASASGVESARDSVSAIQGVGGRLLLPGAMSFGLALEFNSENDEGKRSRWVLALDHRIRDWSQAGEYFGEEFTYADLSTYQRSSFGLMFQPDMDYRRGARGNIFSMATYRLGAYAADSHLAPGGEGLAESGMSFGLSLPMLVGGLRRSDTQLDLSVGYHQRGTTERNLIEENYMSFMFGFSFHPERFDNWFQKRKYD